MAGNNMYAPTCEADCEEQVLIAVGNSDCVTDGSVEIAEIHTIYMDEKSSTLFIPKNPIGEDDSYTAWGDNAADLLAWKAAASNSTEGAVRTLYGIGETPQPQANTLTFHKGKLVTLYDRHILTITINIIDNLTYQYLLSLQACKGQFHVWFETDQYFYGGENGVIMDVESVYFNRSGGRGAAANAVIQFGWNAKVDPIRDAVPW